MGVLQFLASLVSSIAWPAAVVVGVVLLRREIVDMFHRMQNLKFPGGEVTFAALQPYGEVLAATTEDAGSPQDQAIVRREESRFSVLAELATVAPAQAIIDAWGLLEYELNIASDRIAPAQQHGWPQVAQTLKALDTWPILFPLVRELRRLRDYTAGSRRPPSSANAAHYVSLAQDVVTTLRTSVLSKYGDDSGGDA